MLDLIYKHISLQTLIWLVVAIPLAGAFLNGLLAFIYAGSERARGKFITTTVGVLTPLASFVAVTVLLLTLMGFEAGRPSAITGPLFQWVASKDLVISFGLKADELSLLAAFVVALVGLFVHMYSAGYMSGDRGIARYFSFMNLFLFSMQLFVLADNLLVMFVGWELMGLCSYLLIGFWFDEEKAAKASFKAYIINSIGDCALLAAMFIMFAVINVAGAGPDVFDLFVMEHGNAYFMPVAGIVSFLVLTAAVSKSAQLPLHVWLPDAMEAPLPVSALIHAATMVAAGVYLIVRLSFIFTMAPHVLDAMAVIGVASAVFGAVMAIVSLDVKRILAYSTISQIGYMFLALGVGAFQSATFHLVTHAFFKCLLFLSAGSVIFALGGEQDIRKMGGLKKRMPVTAWTFLFAAVSLAGIFPLSGFFSKDAILWQAYERGAFWLWLAGFACAGLTAFYIFRLAGRVFFGEPTMEMEKFKRVTEPGISMMVPLMLLAVITIGLGAVGVPEALWGKDWLGLWLGGVIPYGVSRLAVDGSHAKEIVLMVVTVLWSAHFSILGWVIYAQKREWPETMARKLAFAYRLCVNGLYLDKLYEFGIARPIAWFSGNVLWRVLDETIVGGLATDGTARAVGFFGAVACAMQNGVLQRYLLYFLIGATVVIGYLTM